MSPQDFPPSGWRVPEQGLRCLAHRPRGYAHPPPVQPCRLAQRLRDRRRRRVRSCVCSAVARGRRRGPPTRSSGPGRGAGRKLGSCAGRTATQAREKNEEPDRDASAEEQPGDGKSAEEKPGEDREARLCVWSHRRQARDDAILERQRKSFEEEVRDLHAGLSVKGRTKRCEKVLERLGRITERHSKVARQYEIAVRPAQKKQGKQRLAAAVTLRRSKQHAERTAQAGCYVLRTSHAAWDTQRIVQTYWQMAAIEATFRSLKSEVGLRPVYLPPQAGARAGAPVHRGAGLPRDPPAAAAAAGAGHPRQLDDDPAQAVALDAADDAAASRGRVLDRDAPGHATGRGGGGDRGGAGPAGTAAPAAGAHARAGGGPGIGAPVRGPAIRWGEKSCGDITATARL